MVDRGLGRASFMIGFALVVACGESTSDSSGKKKDGGAGSAGTAGTAGTAGKSGTGGTSGFVARKCGSGEPCAPGATCAFSSIESGVNCECDSSGHYLCGAWAGGGAPPIDTCTETTAQYKLAACSGDPTPASCSESNGWCTRTCDCNAGTCSVACSGNGPAEGNPGYTCDLGYCATEFGQYGGCEIRDGSCSYSVKCNTEPPELDGSCS